MVVNGVLYSGSNVTNCSGQTVAAPYSGAWCVSTSSLSIGSYDVVATITNASGYTLQDKTVNELVIGDASLTYSVTYNGNGNNTGTAPTDATAYSFNGTVTVSGNTGTLTKTGVSFGGWNTKADGSGAMYSPGSTFSIGANTTLYAYWTTTLYTVSFTSNSGSAVNSQSVAYGGTAVEPPAPTRSGYSFDGWYNEIGLTSLFNFSTPITANKTLYAKWSANAVTSYTVSFNSNGGSAVTSQTVNNGSPATQPSNPTQTGYTFEGWYSDSGLTTAFSFSTAITGATTLYAKWTANAPSATTGSASSVSQTSATLNGTVNPNGLSTTVTFQRGTTTAYGTSITPVSSPLIASAGSTGVSVNLTGLTCNTTYHFRVVASSSGGTTNGSDQTFTTSACSGGSLSGEVSRKKLNPGYEKVAGITVNLINSSNSTVATTTTDANGAYSFTSVAAGTYSVSFSTPTGARGVKAGSANANASSSTITGLVVTEGAALTGANAVVVDPAGVIYDANTRLPLAGAAVWLYKDNLLVANTQLDTSLGTVNGALTGSDGQYSLALNGTATTGTYELRVTPPAGYAFQSTLIPASSTNSSSAYTPQLGGRTEAIQTQTTAPTGADPTVYQLWFSFTITSNLATTSNGVIHNHIPLDPQYSVSFNTNGGSVVSSQTINHGSLATQPSNPTRTDYTFAGWFSDSGLTTAFNFSTAITGATTLYAKWTANTPTAITGSASSATVSGVTLAGTVNDNGQNTTVSFDYGLSNTYGMSVNATTGGSINAGSGSMAVSVTLSGLSCGTTYHYRVSATSTGGTVYGSDATFSTSSCSAGTVAMSFQSNGGSAVNSQNVTSGSAPTRPADPTRTGYSFTGWFSDSGLTQAFNFSAPISVSTTAWAGWQINTYSISISVSPTGSGTLVCSPNPVPHGSTVVCTATANANHTLVSFNGACSGNTCSLSNVTSAISVSATFINNLAPQATGVQINGDPQNGLTLTGVYTFSDNENDPQGTSTFRWLQSNNSQGNNPTVISGVTGLTFTPADQHEGQYIIFCVVPRAISGVLNGAEVCSSPLGPVAPEDIDGVTPTIEGNVPARGNRIQGDGNGDGIPDRLQNHVASLPTTVGNAYATVVSESSKQLSSVSSQPTPNTLPSSLRAPYGALQFNAEGVAPSASEIFTIHLPYDRRIAGAMKFNRFSQQWDMIGTVTHDGTTATAIRFTLQNGGPYDADGDANNNQIRDPIVPVYNTYTVSVTVSGLLPGQTLVLGNNGNDTLTFNGNGSLTFATVLLESDPYNVTALSAPAGSSCTITGGSGTMPAANVNAIIIDCTSATTTAPPTTAHPIPTLSQWGMLLTSLLMIGAGLWMRPRFKTKLSRL